MTQPILPPATIGIIGGGQLGMMIAREAQRMGYRTVVWDPEAECPASRLADEAITAPFNDRAAAERLANLAEVITYEFENVDPEIVEWIEQTKPVFPGSGILRIAQHRREEKEELKRRGFPTVAYLVASGVAEVRGAIRNLGLPVVIKTATSGYDGKGQTVIRTGEDIVAWEESGDGRGEFIVEQWIDLSCELSVVAARTRDGLIVTFPVGENVHRENILHRTIVPASISHDIQVQAIRIAREIMDKFQVVGVLCTEMFVTRQGEVLVNELAPRPHNSGHYTLDACDVSQFEAVVRTVCGLPVKQPRLLTPCAMINLLGKHLDRLHWKKAMALPGVKVHVYGKRESRPKRKMGHLTVLNYSSEEVWNSVTVVEEMIGEGESVEASTRIQAGTVRQR